jgi:hypothetical protein
MHRSKQLKSVDHFVGVGEQKKRDCDLAELGPHDVTNAHFRPDKFRGATGKSLIVLNP